MPTLSSYIQNEQHLINTLPLDATTKKVGQIYCYLSSGPIMMVKIGKGKNGRQRMATWLQEYPPAWRNGKVVFVSDRVNQSTSESALHKLFQSQSVKPDDMRMHLGKESWETLPDGATEWFYVDNKLIAAFESVGYDLRGLYEQVGGSFETMEQIVDSYTGQDDYTEAQVNKILDGQKQISRWDVDSDCRELTEYVNALLSYQSISTERGEFDYYLQANNGLGGHTAINIFENSTNRMIANFSVFKTPEGGYRLLTKDLYTQLQLHYVRDRRKQEKRNSSTIRTEFVKVLINSIAQAIKSHLNPPSQVQEVPVSHRMTFPNGRKWSDETTYSPIDNYKIPVQVLLKELDRKLTHGGVYGKLTNDLPIGPLSVSLTDSAVAGNFNIVVEFGDLKKINFNVPAYNLNPEQAAQNIIDQPVLNYDSLYKEFSPNFNEEQMQQARTSRAFSNFFMIVFGIAIVVTPIALISSAVTATGNFIEDVRN